MVVVVGVMLTIIGLSAIEGFLSVATIAHDLLALAPLPNRLQVRYDSLAGWSGIPNLSQPNGYGAHVPLSTNAQGFRVAPASASAASGNGVTILCSGDELTFGAGVADSATFCADLERALPGTRTVNMAQRGYGIDQAYLIYKRDASQLPHQVHLFAFQESDFARLTSGTFAGYPKPTLTITDGTVRAQHIPVSQWSRPSRGGQVSQVLNGSRLVQLWQRVFGRSDKADRRGEQMSVAEGVFQDLARITSSHGASLVLVYLPTRNDLLPGAGDAIRKRVASFSARSGIPFVDLTPALRSIPADTVEWMLITPNEVRASGVTGLYTAKGHAWVADQLADQLRRLGALNAGGLATARHRHD